MAGKTKKPRKYRESTLANWKQLFPWMEIVTNQEGEESKYDASCPICKITLKLKHTQLVRHQSSKTHIKLTGYEESKSKKQTLIKNDETVTVIEQTNVEDNENTNEQDQEEHIEESIVVHNSDWPTGTQVICTLDAPVVSQAARTDIHDSFVRILAVNPEDHNIAATPLIIVKNEEENISSKQTPIVIQRPFHINSSVSQRPHVKTAARKMGSYVVTSQSIPISYSLPVNERLLQTNKNYQINKHSLLKKDFLKLNYPNRQTIIVEEKVKDDPKFLDSNAWPENECIVQVDSKEQDKNLPEQPQVAMIRSSSQYPEHLRVELEQRLVFGKGSDVIWRCGHKENGGKDMDTVTRETRTQFNVHKFVLALNSKVFQRTLVDGAIDCDIYTPDFSPTIVKSLLFLFYTGRTMVCGDQRLIDDIKNALSILEVPVQTVSTEVVNSSEQALDISSGVQIEERFENTTRTDNTKSLSDINDIKVEVEDYSPNTKEIQTTNNVEENLITHPNQSSLGGRNLRKPEENKATVIENEEDDLEYQPDDNEVESFENQHKDNDKVEDEDFALSYEKKKNNARDNRDNKYTFHISGNTKRSSFKGAKSNSLKYDLFDNLENPEKKKEITSITVCHICYQYFASPEQLNPHIKQFHSQTNKKKGEYHIGKNEFKCSTCDRNIMVQHIVWFIKHIRFCGKDDVKANDILGPGDKDEELIQAYKSTKENQEDCYHHRPDKVAEISKFLFGQVKAEIWGCRTCYEGFETEIELENHRTKDHEGRVRHGTLYDMASKVFTCPACNFIFKKCHLVKFIYHRKKCSMDSELGLQQDLEEDFLEDDTTDHTIDPWGVVNKPLRIINDRSRWICEALTGNFYPIIYPCHVCYQVLTDEKLIKEHFRAEHPNVENCCENGHYYNRKTDSYTCPCCKKQVCKNQKNSIFFIHHMQKCQGVNHLVVWSCDKCEKEFTQFRTYTYHMKTNCETQDFICHICKMQLKTRKDLRNHLTFVHSTFRPHVCNMCSKSFKRKGDLVSHQKNHDSSIQFSCEHCGKLFNQLKKLKRHMLCHMSYMERPHKCPHCTLRFMLKQKLLNHVATHFDVKKFACDICDVRVKTRDALWAHKKKVHKITAKAGQAIAR